jgi:hypothetical protein
MAEDERSSCSVIDPTGLSWDAPIGPVVDGT